MPAAGREAAGRWDALVEQLVAQRERVGSPSYRELAEGVVAARVAGGADPYAARVGKTTVYDCFRTGRPRINLGLVREIAQVMGAGSDEVDAWVRRCHPPAVVDPAIETSVDAPGETPVDGPVPDAPAPRPSARHVLGLMALAVVLNLVGRAFVLVFDLPFHLDMVGTAVAAIALGPWRAAAVGAGTSVLGVGLSGSSSLAFGVVNVAGALAWGYGVRRFTGGRSIPRFVWWNLVTALVCTLVAVPILLGFYDGATRGSFDHVTSAFDVLWSSHATSVLLSNYVTSALDKVLSGFLALTVVAALPLALRPRLPIVLAAAPGVVDHREPARRRRV